MSKVVQLVPKRKESETVKAFRILEVKLWEAAMLILNDLDDVPEGSDLEEGLDLLTDLIGNIHTILEGDSHG